MKTNKESDSNVYPSSLVPQLILQAYKDNILHDTFQAATLFADISGFTALTETLLLHKKNGAELLSTFMAGLFEPMSSIIYNHGGFIAQFAGDAFTAIFPDTLPDNKLHAASTAWEIQKYIAENNTIITEYGTFTVNIKIGLSHGVVEWGIVEIPGKADFYFKGEAINACANAEHSAKPGFIIADELFAQGILSEINFQKHDENLFCITGLASVPLSVEPPQIKPLNVAPFFSSQYIRHMNTEFRDVCAVFISYEPPPSIDDLHYVITQITELIERFGGYLVQLDFGDKGAIALAMFGMPISYENDVERACACACSLRTALSYISIRIGIHYGIVWAGLRGGKERKEYSAFGDTINTASRLVMSAEPGQILLSEEAQVLADHMYETVCLGTQRFKGKSNIVTVFTLINKKPQASSLRFLSPMIDRKTERTMITEAADLLKKNSNAGLILLYGEPGIGKTRLLYETREIIGETCQWLQLTTDRILRKPFHPFSECISHFFKISTITDKAIKRSVFSSEYDTFLTTLNDASPLKNELIRLKSILAGLCSLYEQDSLWSELESKDRHETLIYAVQTVLFAIASAKPLTVIFDDAQWLDDESINIVHSLAKNMSSYPMLIIVAYRLEDDGSRQSFPSDGTSIIREINLTDFDYSIVFEHIRSLLKGQPSEQLARFIYTKTSGNPLFTEHLVEYCRENNLITTTAEDTDKLFDITAVSVTEIPDTVAKIFISRLDRLPAHVKELVKTASVLGYEFDRALLAAVCGRNIQKDLLIARQQQIFIPINDSVYKFSHNLLRDATYDMQMRSALKDIHKKAITCIETIFTATLEDKYPELIYHCEESGDSRKLLSYLEKAARLAKSRYQNQTALDFYDKLITLSDDSDAAFMYNDEKVEILLHIGLWQEAESLSLTMLETAENKSDPYQTALARITYAQTLYHNNKYDESIAYTEKAAEYFLAQNDLKPYGLCMRNLGNIYLHRGKYHEAMDYLRKLLAVSEKIDDKRSIGMALGNIGVIYFDQGAYSEAMTCYEKQLTIYREINYKKGCGLAIGNIGLVFYNTGDLVKALECYEEQLSVAKEIGDMLGTARAYGRIGMIHDDRLELDEAMECYQKRLSLCEQLGEKRGMSIACENIGTIHEKKGLHDDALIWYKKGFDLYKEIDDEQGLSNAYYNIGMSFFYKNNYLKALSNLNKAISLAQSLGIQDYLCDAMLGKAETCFLISQINNDNDALKEADYLNNEVITLAASIQYNYIIFFAQLLHARISSVLRPEETAEEFQKLLTTYTEPQQQAEILYELTQNGNDKTMMVNALELYTKLYKKYPLALHRDRLTELEKRMLSLGK